MIWPSCPGNAGGLPGAILLAACLLSQTGCSSTPTAKDSGAEQVLVVKIAKLPGGPEAWERLLDGFRAEHAGLAVHTEWLPNASDEQHLFYVINLEAGAADFDVFALDVVWVQEFARAGWLLDLTERLTSDELRLLRDDYFRGAAACSFLDGRCYAIPWFTDAGLLYYREDLLSRYGLSPPRSWDELARQAQLVRKRQGDPALAGFLFQGKQYEGLVCAALEVLRGHGGDVLRGGKPSLNDPACVRALEFLRELVVSDVSPPMVRSADEEATRRLFGDGKAVFLRNWPYAWTLFQAPGSAVRGKVGIARVPAQPGAASAPTLGGWQFGVNRNSRRPRPAVELVRYFMRPDIQRRLVLELGLTSARRSVLRNPEILAANPFLGKLVESLESACPRPLSPYYLAISHELQSAFSGVVAGIRQPAPALAQAQRRIEGILAQEAAR